MLSNCFTPAIQRLSDNKVLETVRSDGRNFTELRPLICEFGMINDATGSALLHVGETIVVCSVHGPRPITGGAFASLGKLECDFKFAPFAVPTNLSNNDSVVSLEKMYSSIMLDTLQSTIRLEMYPKAIISVHAVVLREGGGGLAAAITCGSLALANASVEQYDIVTACTVSRKNGKLWLDPTSEEISDCDASLTIGMISSVNEATQILSEGRIDQNLFLDMLRLSSGACKAIRTVVTKCLTNKI